VPVVADVLPDPAVVVGGAEVDVVVGAEVDPPQAVPITATARITAPHHVLRPLVLLCIMPKPPR
jgi:hypothetical protein